MKYVQAPKQGWLVAMTTNYAMDRVNFKEILEQHAVSK